MTDDELADVAVHAARIAVLRDDIYFSDYMWGRCDGSRGTVRSLRVVELVEEVQRLRTLVAALTAEPADCG